MNKKFRTLFFLTLCLFFFPGFLRAEKNKICLTMIVKNEEKIIERCLDSAKGVIDCVSICDTGSTDNTVKIIESYLKKNNIPGKVFQQTWKNFGFNRTLSAESAQQLLKELKFPLQNTYLLLLDADMVLEVDPAFKKDNLLHDSYAITQKNDYISYYNTRLIRASLPWHCVGVTHEYWSCKQNAVASKSELLSIDDREDGGSKSDKFERDIKMLTEGLQNEPDNVRYMFYLAQSYKSLNNFDESIKWYKKRIEKGGWNEEVWYSKFMIGQCYESKGEWEKALHYYLEAYQQNPDRAESLQHISTYYRNKQEYNLSYSFAKLGSQIPYPKEQMLFISDSVYDYLFDYDLSIVSYYTPHKEDGFIAANNLILRKNIPKHIKDQAYTNILFYVEKLPNAEYKPIEIELPFIREGLATRYNPLNPSIQKTEKGYDVICRTVNYTQIGAKHFQTLDIDDETNTIRTKNFLVKYDKDLKVLSQKEIVENLPRQRYNHRNIYGLEDCRLYELNHAIGFSCTTLDTNPKGMPQISICTLNSDTENKTCNVEKLTPLMCQDLSRCEKNWLPFVKNQSLHMIYSYDPFIIYCPKIENNRCYINKQMMVCNYIPTHDFSRFSGSASPIAFDNGYLFLVHETVYTSQRNYLHRFVYMDSDFNIQKVSKPFIFLHKGVEYCCGMAIDHPEKKLIMTIGIEDREAYFSFVDLDTVRSLLEPLP